MGIESAADRRGSRRDFRYGWPLALGLVAAGWSPAIASAQQMTRIPVRRSTAMVPATSAQPAGATALVWGSPEVRPVAPARLRPAPASRSAAAAGVTIDRVGSAVRVGDRRGGGKVGGGGHPEGSRPSAGLGEIRRVVFNQNGGFSLPPTGNDEFDSLFDPETIPAPAFGQPIESLPLPQGRPEAQAAPPAPTSPAPTSPAPTSPAPTLPAADDSIGGFLENEPSPLRPDFETIPRDLNAIEDDADALRRNELRESSPSDRPDGPLFDDNPFGRRSRNDTDDPLERLEDRERQLPGGPDRDDDRPSLLDPRGTGAFDKGITCEEFRRRIAAETIDRVSLDISPPFRPDVIEEAEYERLKAEFDEGQEIRQWTNRAGQPVTRGRLVDLAYENVVIATESGGTERVPINRISEVDLAYISKNWGLPNECLLQQVAYTPRTWSPITMTWAASNLCHKPLYFQEVNLERYGHTAGPIAQPIISSAHFFANIAVLPYKMGVHSPHECQYALGYYRPGNCAPWIIPPVPLSVKGSLYQAAAMTGTALLVP